MKTKSRKLTKGMMFLVYILLFLSMYGIIFLDNHWKELGYLLVMGLMMDILYGNYYNKNEN